jgi:catechol 2,3-dioxygenase-like lactoylglutathione lyase family enzyme
MRLVVGAEAHDVFPRADDAQERAGRVLAQFQPGTIHRRAGKFAMRRVVVAGGGHAVAQQAAMEGEAAIGLGDAGGGARCIEAAGHGQIDAVEARRPDHAAHPGQDHHLAPAVPQPQAGDAGVVAEQAGGQLARGQDLALNASPARPDAGG